MVYEPFFLVHYYLKLKHCQKVNLVSNQKENCINISHNHLIFTRQIFKTPSRFLKTFSLINSVLVLLWLLHQKGLFDPLYDWWEDHCWHSNRHHKKPKRHGVDIDHHRKRQAYHHRHGRNHVDYHDHGHHHAHRLHDYERQLHHVHKDKHKHGRHRTGGVLKQMRLEGDQEEGGIQHHRHMKERKAIKRVSRLRRPNRECEHELYVDEDRLLKEDGHHKHHKLLIERRQ